MFGEKRVVDNRVFLLGLAELYRDAMKGREAGELPTCARRVAQTLGIDILASLLATILIGLLCTPPEMDVLINFYSRIRPFGFWGPVKREAVRRGLIPANDPMPTIDALNGILTAGFQFSLALVPFYALLQIWDRVLIWTGVVLILALVLYFTWYKNLPEKSSA